MLTKLIKLDLRFAYKQFLTMTAIIVLLGLAFPYMEINYMEINFFKTTRILYITTFTIIPVISILLVIQHFQRNLFGNEGYLMFSLPVSAMQLLISKVITTVIWFNLMLLAAALCAILAVRFKVSLHLLFRDFFDWDTTIATFKDLLLVNANVLPIILSIFMGTALSTVAVRNRKLGNFWGIVAATIGSAFFFWSCLKTGAWKHMVQNGQTTTMMLSIATSENINLLLSAAFCLLFFGLTTFIMKRYLNLA